jgi:hypothetical protein
VDWIHRDQDRDHWRDLVNTAMNLGLLWKTKHFFTSWATVSFSRRTLLLAVLYNWQKGVPSVSTWPCVNHKNSPLTLGEDYIKNKQGSWMLTHMGETINVHNIFDGNVTEIDRLWIPRRRWKDNIIRRSGKDLILYFPLNVHV